MNNMDKIQRMPIKWENFEKSTINFIAVAASGFGLKQKSGHDIWFKQQKKWFP